MGVCVSTFRVLRRNVGVSRVLVVVGHGQQTSKATVEDCSLVVGSLASSRMILLYTLYYTKKQEFQ